MFGFAVRVDDGDGLVRRRGGRQVVGRVELRGAVAADLGGPDQRPAGASVRTQEKHSALVEDRESGHTRREWTRGRRCCRRPGDREAPITPSMRREQDETASHIPLPSTTLRLRAALVRGPAERAPGSGGGDRLVVEGRLPPTAASPFVGATMNSWHDVMLPSVQLDPVALAMTG